jgi:hypothetical protein
MPNEGQTAPPWWSYLWDCCVGVYGTFRSIPTVESYGAGVFVPARTLIAIKLLIGTDDNDNDEDNDGRRRHTLNLSRL